MKIKPSVLALSSFVVWLSGAAHATDITINPSDDGALYTCTGCNTVNNGGYVTVAGYIQGIVIFPTAAITGPVTSATLTVNPYGLPLWGLDVDVYGISETNGVISAADANAGSYLGTLHLSSSLGYGQDASFDITSFLVTNHSSYVGFNLRSGGTDIFSSMEYNYGHPSQLHVAIGSPVVTAPTITQQPMNQTVSAGGTATFNVTANGTAPVYYQWRWNTTNLMGATNATLILNDIQPSQAGNYSVQVTNAGGVVVSSNALLTIQSPPNNLSPWLVNVDFGSGGTRGYSLKTGFAALGNATNDFWNFYDRDASSTSGDWRTSGTLSNLKLSDNTVSPVGLTVSDAPGAWDDGSSDPMYNTYIYPLDGGNDVITFTNLPAGSYDLLAYSPDGNFEVTAGGTSYGVKTCYDNPVSSTPIWTEGIQYVRYKNVILAPGAPLVLTAHPTGRNPALLSGVQIVGNSTAATCTPSPAGLVSWWPAEGNATDIVSGNNGITSPGLNYATGEVGQAFLLNNTNSFFHVPANSSLNVGLGNGFTIEGWIKPSNVNGLHPIVEWNNGAGGIGVQLWIGQNPYSQGVLCAFFLDTNANNYVQVPTPSGKLVANTWQHVALDYDRSTQVIKLFINGSMVAQSNWTGDVPQTSYDLWVGQRPNDCVGCWTYGATLTGPLDELSLYNRALSSDEIQAIYTAGSAGKCLPALVAPQIIQQPTNQTVLAGSPVAFSVTATGTSPLAYQWLFNSIPLIGATNSTLVLSNVQLTNAGTYSVLIANLAGSTNSTNATLTVTLPVCTPPPSGLVAWWQAENNTLDSAGTNNGINVNNVTYAISVAGSAFQINGSNYVSVADAPALNPTNAITVEGWLFRKAVMGTWDPVVKKSDSTQVNGYSVEFNGNNLLFWVYNNGWHSSGGSVPIKLGQWYHFAGVYNGARLMCYTNGILAASIATSGSIKTSANSLRIGNDPSNPATRFFNGLIDEVSLYNRALSSNEIAAIFAAHGAGKCPLPPTILSVTPTNYYVNEGTTVSYAAKATGSPILAYQWQHEGTDIPGATSSMLTLSNAVYAQAGNYTVTVSNLAGMAISSNVTLRVNRAPIADASASESLVISPNGTNATVILNGSRSRDPDGDPLSYAWFHSGDSIAFATGVIATPSLPVGSNQLVLTVSDGMAANSQSFVAEVISTAQAVDRLIELVKVSGNNSQPLIASLQAALSLIDRNQPQAAINQLEAFINKVKAQLAPTSPDLAAQLIADAQAIIDALNGGDPTLATPVQITAFIHGHNGKHHLNIQGVNGRIYVVETSTNMVDWTPVGIATKATDGDYEFDDTEASESGARFYRIVSPK